MTGPAPGDRLSETTVGPFDAAALVAYARASGDDNPLHIDAGLATAAGFAAPPVHGMRLMAEIEPALRAWRPEFRIKRLAGTFAEPLLAGETAKLSGRVLKASGEAPAEILMRVTIQGPRRGPCVIAEATMVSTNGRSAS